MGQCYTQESNLQVLRFFQAGHSTGSFDMDGAAMEALVRPLKGGDGANNVLQELDLSYRCIDDDAVEQLAAMLRQNSSPNKLAFRTSLGLRGRNSIARIGEALCSDASLSELKIWNTTIRAEGMAGLMRFAFQRPIVARNPTPPSHPWTSRIAS